MLTLYNEKEQPAYPLDVSPETYYITHAYDGQDLLSFELPTDHEYYAHIANEVRVEANDNRYIIRSIDDSVIDCQLDLDDWYGKFYKEYKTTESYLSQVLDAIKPAGWTYSGAGVVSIRRTIEKEKVTSWDILQQAASTYDVVFNFDTLNKRLSVIVPDSINPSGEYLTEELNLKKIAFKGLSTDIATRIYPYGKDGLTIADVNSGKEYVENLGYSKHIIAVAWEDDRYTIAANLKADAVEKLQANAFPVCSYECEVVDLAKTNPEYDFLIFWMYKVVTLIDRQRKTRINHQIVEYKEYPLSPDKNVVTLSSTAPRIENTVKELKKEITEKVEDSKNYMEDAIKHNTEMILGNKGGTFLWGMNADGQPETLYTIDTQKLSTAKNLWIWNKSGIGISHNGLAGPIVSAWTIDGKFNADLITFGTLKGSLIEANSITAKQIKTGELQVGWNNISRYVKISYSDLGIYDGSNTLLMQLNSNGQEFYNGGRYLGKTGVNQWTGRPEVKGIVSQLAYGGANYMAWSKQETSGGNYIVYLTYHDGTIDSDGLHLGRNMYLGGRTVRTTTGSAYAALTPWTNGGGISFDYQFQIAGLDNKVKFVVDNNNVNCYRTLNMDGNDIVNQSDARLKTNITPVSSGVLDALCEIPVESYDWIEDGRHVDAGIVADKLELVLPELVHRDGDDVRTVNYVGLIPYLIKSIQELRAETGGIAPKMRMATIQQEDYYEYQDKLALVEQLKQKRKAIPVEPEDISFPPEERTEHEPSQQTN